MPPYPPSKRATLVGGVVGTGIGQSSVLVLDYLVVTITLCLLYSVGVTLPIDNIRILRGAPHDGGRWVAIAFGDTVGHVLLVFGVALVSLMYGIGIPFADLSEY
ncbi:hypothetical protein [Halorhabdus salina]|uniref:hypothetical protein n=1 Tax=Halorhabdus salina TaxID=2750670 RepID=UPI0015EFC059|nr:hypothetical protein [Halorhabdus salina]